MIEKVEYIYLLFSIVTDKAYNTTLNIFTCWNINVIVHTFLYLFFIIQNLNVKQIYTHHKYISKISHPHKAFRKLNNGMEYQ